MKLITKHLTGLAALFFFFFQILILPNAHAVTTTSKKITIRVYPKMTSTTVKKINVKTLSSIMRGDDGIVLKFSDGSYFPIHEDNAVAALSDTSLKALVKSIGNTLKGLKKGIGIDTTLNSEGRLADDYLKDILQDSGISVDENLLENLAVMDALATSIRTDYVHIDAMAEVDMLMQELNEIFTMASNSLEGGYTESTSDGSYVHIFHGYQEGNSSSGQNEVWLCSSTECFLAGGEDEDENNDGKKDDDSAWDNFWDWIAGEDTEGDGITAESEAGTFGIMMNALVTRYFVETHATELANMANKYAAGKMTAAQFKKKLATTLNASAFNAYLSSVFDGALLKSFNLQAAPTMKNWTVTKVK